MLQLMVFFSCLAIWYDHLLLCLWCLLLQLTTLFLAVVVRLFVRRPSGKPPGVSSSTAASMAATQTEMGPTRAVLAAAAAALQGPVAAVATLLAACRMAWQMVALGTMSSP